MTNREITNPDIHMMVELSEILAFSLNLLKVKITQEVVSRALITLIH